MDLDTYIEILQGFDPETILSIGLSNPHSWRGSYDELAFEPVENITVKQMLEAAMEAYNSTYSGWKGGEYKMYGYTNINIDFKGVYSDSKLTMKLLLNHLADNILTMEELEEFKH